MNQQDLPRPAVLDGSEEYEGCFYGRRYKWPVVVYHNVAPWIERNGMSKADEELLYNYYPQLFETHDSCVAMPPFPTTVIEKSQWQCYQKPFVSPVLTDEQMMMLRVYGRVEV